MGTLFLAVLGWELVANAGAFLYGVPASFAVLLAVPILVLLATVASVVLAVRGWRDAGRSARVHHVVLLLGLAAFGWFVWHWNLVGWQY